MQVCLDIKIGKLLVDSQGISFRADASLETILKPHTNLYQTPEEVKETSIARKSKELSKIR
jgi:hypothetical protein